MTGILAAAQGRFGRATLLDIERPLASHAHPHVQLLFKLGGADRGLLVGDEVVGLDDSHCVQVNPWQLHADLDALCSGPSQVLALYLDADWFHATTGLRQDTLFASARCPLDNDTREGLTDLAEAMNLGAANATDFVERSIACAIAAILPKTLLVSERRANDFRIRRAILRLGGDVKAHADLSDLARQVGLSRSRFFDQFKSTIGVAPLAYRDGLLVERAIDLLIASDAPLDAISRQLGFAAPSSFSRFFRERVGFPPRTLRSAAAV